MIVASILIPGHVVIDKTVYYTLAGTLNDGSSYTKQQRYTSFYQLHQLLLRSLGSSSTVAAFPAKQSFSFGMLQRTAISSNQINDRRIQLQLWIRSLLSSKDTRYSTSNAFVDFIAPSASTGTAAGSSSVVSPSAAVTATTWLSHHSHLTSQCTSLRADLSHRNALARSASSSFHSASHQANQLLLSLVVDLNKLEKDLGRLANDGMVEGELTRRKGMLGGLRDQVERLGEMAKDVPRPDRAAGSSSSNGMRDEDERANGFDSSNSVRSSLFSTSSNASSSKSPARVLGSSASLETAQTRPLPTSSLLQLQATSIAEQDQYLESLTASLRKQRELGLMIGKELEEQGELLGEIEGGVERVKGKIDKAGKVVKRLG